MINHRVVRGTLVHKLDCEEIRGGKEGHKYHFYVQNRRIATTLLPKRKGGRKQIGFIVLGRIANQLFVTTSQLREIIDCVHEREGYIEMLRNSALLERAPGSRAEFLSELLS